LIPTCWISRRGIYWSQRFPSRRAGLFDSYLHSSKEIVFVLKKISFHPGERDCLIPTVKVIPNADYEIVSDGFPSRRAGLFDSCCHRLPLTHSLSDWDCHLWLIASILHHFSQLWLTANFFDFVFSNPASGIVCFLHGVPIWILVMR